MKQQKGILKVLDKTHELPPPPLTIGGKIVSSWHGEREEPAEPFHGSSDYLIPGLQSTKMGEDELNAAFSIIDFEERGTIDVNAIRRALHMCGERFEEYEVDDMIRMVDFNADGQVGPYAFRSLFAPPPAVFKNYDIGKHEAQEIRDDAAEAAGKPKAKAAPKKKPQAVSREEAKAIMDEFTGGHGLQPKFVRETFQRFLHIDKDGSGTLSFKEFCDLMQQEPSPLLQNLFKMFDKDGSGELDGKEFIVGLSGYASGSVQEKIKFAFAMFDDDQSGSLDRAEVTAMMRSIAPELNKDQISRRVDNLYNELNLPMMTPITLVEFQNLARLKPELVLPAYTLSKIMEDAALEEVKKPI